MTAGEIVIREATAADMPGIAHVRTSVVENHLSPAQLAARGITNASVAASFLADSRGWVAEEDGRIVAFAIADRASRSLFALFALPEHEGRGFGSRLHDLALDWLWGHGADTVWLTTGPGTRAAAFYERRGWVCTGEEPGGDLRYELRRPGEAPA